MKQLYRELDLEQVFHRYEEESYQNLMALIAEQTAAVSSLPSQIFQEFAGRIYKRKN